MYVFSSELAFNPLHSVGTAKTLCFRLPRQCTPCCLDSFACLTPRVAALAILAQRFVCRKLWCTLGITLRVAVLGICIKLQDSDVRTVRSEQDAGSCAFHGVCSQLLQTHQYNRQNMHPYLRVHEGIHVKRISARG